MNGLIKKITGINNENSRKLNYCRLDVHFGGFHNSSKFQESSRHWSRSDDNNKSSVRAAGVSVYSDANKLRWFSLRSQSIIIIIIITYLPSASKQDN